VVKLWLLYGGLTTLESVSVRWDLRAHSRHSRRNHHLPAPTTSGKPLSSGRTLRRMIGVNRSSFTYFTNPAPIPLQTAILMCVKAMYSRQLTFTAPNNRVLFVAKQELAWGFVRQHDNRFQSRTVAFVTQRCLCLNNLSVRSGESPLALLFGWPCSGRSGRGSSWEDMQAGPNRGTAHGH